MMPEEIDDRAGLPRTPSDDDTSLTAHVLGYPDEETPHVYRLAGSEDPFEDGDPLVPTDDEWDEFDYEEDAEEDADEGWEDDVLTDASGYFDFDDTF